MNFNWLQRKQSQPGSDGVYADLDSLMRLQAKASGFSFLPRQPIHSLLAGRHASRLRGRGLNFEEIRGYLPGDDVRQMDWKVTARMRKPHLRVYTEERDRPALLVVDQRTSMFFGSRRCMKSVAAAEAAALGAWRVLAVGDRIGAIIFNDSEIIEIRPHRSRQRVTEILSAIVKLNRQLDVRTGTRSNPGMFNSVLEMTRRVAKHDHLVMFVSDGAGVDDESVRHVTNLSEHNDVLSLFIYDPLEADLPETGKLVVTEDGGQLEIDTSDRKLRQCYRDDFQQRLDWLKHISRQRSIPLLPISTAEGVAEQVRKQLGHPLTRS